MSDLASLYIKVDSKGVTTASKGLNKLTDDSKKTETATEGVTRGFSKLQAVVIALASSYALLKMAQYIKDVALLAARYETLGVVMRVVGNNAGYSEAQMDKFARGLQKSGIAMIESRNTLARMIQAQIDLTSSQKLARIAQNAAVIGNMNSSAAFEHMIYGLQTGMPRILRTIGLNVNFDASVRALADSLGIKRKAMSEVQVMQGRVNAVIKAGILIEGAYEGAMETAGKKLTSFIRYVDDFKVKMGEAFGPATVMLVDAATQAMKDMQEQISRPEAQEALRNLSSQLATVIVQLGKDLPKVIEGATKAVVSLTVFLNSLMKAYILFSESVSFSFYMMTNRVDKLYPKLDELTGKLFGIKKILVDLDTLTYSFFNIEKLEEALKEVPFFIQAKLLEMGIEVGIKIDEEGINQFEKMQEMLSKGIPVNLDFALEDPDKYFGEIASALKLVWEKEGFESIEKWYKWIGTLAQEKMDFISGLEDEETRVFEENLAYRLVVLKKYYENIETIAQEARDSDEEWEDQLLRSEKEKADYQKELANEAADYINKLAEAASYYKDLIGFEDTYHEKMLELIEERRKAEIDADKDVTAANAKALKARNELAEEAYNTEISHIKSQWRGYSDMFEGLGQLYDEDSSQRKTLHEIAMAFQVAEQAIMLVTAVRAAVIAVANQGQGDPYTAFARVIAMIGLMAATLAKAGISFGGGSGGASAPVLPASTVLGADAGTGSESIQNSFELLQDTYDMQYRELSGIHDEIKNLNDNISGLVASIFRTGGIDTSYIPTGSTIGSMEKFGQEAFSGIINMSDFGISAGFMGKIFGGGTETKVTGSGISTGAASIRDLAGGGGIGSQQYADVHRHEEGGWFHSDKDYYYTTYKALDESVTRLFNKVFQNMSNTLIELTLGLGTDMNATLNYVFSGAKISLQGMDSDEINDTLTEYFSNIGDKAVDALFGNILGMYQKVGEGLMETAVRILIDKAVILDTLEKTNQAFYGGTISIIAFSESVIKMAGGLDEFIESASMYYDKFFSDEEKHANLQADLLDVFADMNLALPATRAGYRNLVESLNLNTEAGKEAYVTLLKLAEGADEFYSGLEDMQQKLIDAQGDVVSTVQGYVDKLRAARESMRMEGTAFAEQQVTSARLAFNAVLMAARTGDLSGIADIDKVLSTLTTSASSTAGFATRTDYERNFYQTYNAIAELEELAGTQLTIEEKKLDIMQAQLDELIVIAETTIEALTVAREQQAIAALQLESQRTLTAQAELARVQAELTRVQADLEAAQAAPPPEESSDWWNPFSWGWAKGGAFSQGNVIPFRTGDIFNSPHFFPMANGMGLLGEAGPEAIMPLSRGPGGKLGVQSIGADSSELLAEVKRLREEVRAGNFASVKNSNKIAKILARFDDDGLPAERTV